MTFKTVRPYRTKNELLKLSTELSSYARRKANKKPRLTKICAA